MCRLFICGTGLAMGAACAAVEEAEEEEACGASGRRAWMEATCWAERREESRRKSSSCDGQHAWLAWTVE
jgi:hypothetical protein